MNEDHANSLTTELEFTDLQDPSELNIIAGAEINNSSLADIYNCQQLSKKTDTIMFDMYRFNRIMLVTPLTGE